jgi:hypothetical protein
MRDNSLEATMAGRDITQPRTVFEELLRQQDRTYEEIAREFERAALELGERGVSITARHLRRLASGERTGTTPATRRVLQVMFNRRMDELLQPWPGNSPADAPPFSYTAPFAGTPQEILTTAAQRARGFALLAQASTTRELMDQIYDDVRELAIIYSHRSPPEILSRLATTQDILFTLLGARQTPARARQLYFLAGVTSAMLARSSHDLGDPYAALTQTRTGFLCADLADHNGLRAMIRALQMNITYWANRPYESIRYAQSGMQFAAAACNTTAVSIPAVEARAWARLGYDAKTCELIELAERMRDQVRPDDLDDLGGLCTFGRSRQLYCAADALAWLPRRAEMCHRYSEQAVQAYEETSAQDWSFSFQAGSRADLAIARIGRNELDGAADAMVKVFELDPAQRTNPVIQSVRRVHSALRGRLHAGCRPELEDKIREFTSLNLS